MKTARKLTSIVLALVMILSLSITAFAANPTTGTLQVTGDQLGGKKVTAVLMFTANVKDSLPGTEENPENMIGAGDSIGYELVSDWQSFMDTQVTTKVGEHATSEEAYEYVMGLSNQKLYEFAEAAKNYAKDNITGETKTADTETDTATFDNLEAGYYLVYPEAGSTSVLRKTDAVLVNVPSSLSEAMNLNLKTVYPTVEKKVGEDKEDVSAQIGESVDFTLTSHVPEMSDYDTYAFWFVDNMSKGLTLNEDSIVVTIGEGSDAKTPVKGTDYTVEVTPATETTGQVLKIKFANLKAIAAEDAGEKIVVTYSAVLNEDAVVGANTNTAHIEYSNNPDDDGEGHTPGGHSDDDDADVYTFEIVIDKYTGTYGDGATRLAGAVFALKVGDDVVKLVDLSTIADGVVTEAKYRVATADEIADGNTVETVVTPANGKVEIEGLEEGTYYLEEVAAPVGYNKLAEAVTIVISADYSTATATIKYAIDGGEATQSSSIPVENKTGAVLPETGAMGTIGLTIFGVLVVILGVALPRKRNARA